MPAHVKNFIECPHCGNPWFREEVTISLRRESETQFWNPSDPSGIRATVKNSQYAYYCTKCNKELDRFKVSKGELKYIAKEAGSTIKEGEEVYDQDETF